MKNAERPSGRGARVGVAALATLALALAAAGTARAQDEQDSAEALLMRMSRAVEELNYDGVFVYQRGGETDSMRIIHRRDGTRSRERLFSLSGTAREVIRDGETVTCIFPEDRAVLVERGRSREYFPTAFTTPVEHMSASYRLSVAGVDRVAGRETRVVAIDPTASDRYGYRLWLDRETGLLLRSNVVDTGGELLEEVMFTQIAFPETLDDVLLQPAVDSSGFQRITRDETPVTAQDGHDEWDVGWLPRGFALRDRAVGPIATSRMPVEHMVFSDGLAMVSVFVEKLGAADAGQLHGFSSMGAVNAFSTVSDAYQITAVGEVPRQTVRQIAASVSRRAP